MIIDWIATLFACLISLALWAYVINEIAKEKYPKDVPPIEKYLNRIIKKGRKKS